MNFYSLVTLASYVVGMRPDKMIVVEVAEWQKMGSGLRLPAVVVGADVVVTDVVVTDVMVADVVLAVDKSS